MIQHHLKVIGDLMLELDPNHALNFVNYNNLHLQCENIMDYWFEHMYHHTLGRVNEHIDRLWLKLYLEVKELRLVLYKMVFLGKLKLLLEDICTTFFKLGTCKLKESESIF